MVGENGPIKDIDDATEVKKAIFARDVSVLPIHFPQWIGARDHAIGGDDARRPVVGRPQALSLQEISGSQEAIDRLFIDDQVVLPTEPCGPLAIAIAWSLAGRNKLTEPFQDLFFSHFGATRCPHIAPTGSTSSPFRRP